MNDNTKLQLIQELAKGNVKIGQLIMEVHGDNHFHEAENKTHTEESSDSKVPVQRSISSDQMVTALRLCSAYIWGPIA